MNRLMLSGLVLCAGLAPVAKAHPGPRIWVNVQGGKVRTYAGAYPPGNPSDYRISQVFTQELGTLGFDIWDSDFPGYEQVPGGSIPAGTTFSYNIMGPVLWYNPGDATHYPFFETVQAHFAGSPPIPQFAITNEVSQERVTSTGFVAGTPAFAYSTPGDHAHLNYLLLGDGLTAGGGPDGVYALQLQLTAPGYTASDTFYLLLGKNVSACNLDAAKAVLDPPHVVPDFDCDSDVDLADLDLFDLCRTGPSVPLPPASAGHGHCRRADFDQDNDVDGDDFGTWQRCFSGAAPANAQCVR